MMSNEFILGRLLKCLLLDIANLNPNSNPIHGVQRASEEAITLGCFTSKIQMTHNQRSIDPLDNTQVQRRGVNHVHTHTCLSDCDASLHLRFIDVAFFRPPPASNHSLQTSNGRNMWSGTATEFSDTLGRSVFTPQITHFIQRPSYEDHCGEKDDVDEQVGVFVELCYNLG